MATPTKADVVSEFRRSQILDAARQTFARHGLKSATVDQIARAARVAKGTVYLYYRSKDDILRHALDEGLTALGDATIPAIGAPGTIEERLKRFLHAMLEYFDRHRDFLDLCQVELGTELRKSARQKFGQVYAAQTRAWQAALEEARAARAIGPVDAKPTALAIVGFAHGLAMQRLRGWTDATLEADVTQASSLVWKGLSLR
jgi:TetR/AcrR family fatty acid metabolism transcriptional regulator